MKTKKIIYPATMTVSAFIFLGVDAIVSSGSIYDTLAVNGESGRAFALTCLFALVLFAISFTAFLKGLELSQKASSKNKTTTLGLLSCGIAIIISISLLMNVWFIGGDSMRAEWLRNEVEDRVSKGGTINNLYAYAEDEKVSIIPIIDSSENWLACEASNGCLSGNGGGTGNTTLVLSSNLSVAQKALQEIMEISNEYEPIYERIEEALIKLEYIGDMDHLSFDEKLNQAESELSILTVNFNELQNLLPIRTFETLEDSFDVSVNQYLAQGLSPVGARTLFNFYGKHAERYKNIKNDLRRGRLIYIEPLHTPTKLEILTSSSDSLFIWLMSFVLATFGWLMLAIHILQSSQDSEDDSENNSENYQPNTPRKRRDVTALTAIETANTQH